MANPPDLSVPEVLAPAGDAAALDAAVRAGADAVYFGLRELNARARATNFDLSELGGVVDELHRHEVKAYVALNTLVFDSELALLERTALACAEAGVDALIMQDLGAVRRVREMAPQLPIHASTQMTCTDAGSVEFATALGASRVVLARELSLSEVAAIRRATSVELEVFVHGALCVAYSGQCLTSEAIGGRSANRGACAQACRLPYELYVDGVRRDLGERAYLLSPEDLEASALVPELAAAGVASLKIEGRLKGPDYVAAVTALYRRAVDALRGDGEAPAEAQRRRALSTFTRGSGPGFLRGIDHQRLVEGRSCDHRGTECGSVSGQSQARGRSRLSLLLDAPLARGDGVLMEGGLGSHNEVGGRVWGIECAGRDVESAAAGARVEIWLGPELRLPEGLSFPRRLFKTNDPRVEAEIRRELVEAPARVALDLRVRAQVGEPLELEAVSERGRRALVRGDVALERARGAGTPLPQVEEKLARLGDTPYRLRSCAVELAPDVFVPASLLNQLRRQLVEALAEAAVAVAPRAAAGTQAPFDLASTAPPPGGLFALCRNLEQARAAFGAGVDGVYLDFLELTGTGSAFRALRAEFPGRALGVAPPRIRKPGEEKIDRYLRELGPDSLLVRGLGALGSLPRSGDEPMAVGDFSLNVASRLSALEVLRHGVAAFTPAFDLDAAQLGALLAGELGPYAEVVIHHPMPLFHMEHCVYAALLSDGKDHLSCGRPCERHTLELRDRSGRAHPVVADVGCRNTVFHGASQSAAALVEGLRAAQVGRFRIELLRESESETSALVSAYRALLRGELSGRAVWQQLKAESGYGVVRGSLRVVA
ncbi:MAG: U32 family peptidase [Polyangiaceae bacterium]